MNETRSQFLSEGPERFSVDKCTFNSELRCGTPHHRDCHNCPVIRQARIDSVKETREEERRNPGRGAIIRRLKNADCTSIFHVPIPPRQFAKRPPRRDILPPRKLTRSVAEQVRTK